jgi:hypothetical protein
MAICQWDSKSIVWATIDELEFDRIAAGNENNRDSLGIIRGMRV